MTITNTEKIQKNSKKKSKFKEIIKRKEKEKENDIMPSF